MFDGSFAGWPTAYAGAMIENGTWHLVSRNAYSGWYDNPGPGSLIGSATLCVPTPAVVGPVHWTNWNGNSPALRLASASNPNVVCGLVAIENSSHDNGTWSHTADKGFSSGSGDTAYVFQNSGYWWLGGSGQSEAWAACIDRTPGTPEYTWQFYNTNGAGTNGAFFQADLDYTQCFFSGIGGNFGDELPPWQQGAWLSYSGSNFLWTETTYGMQEAQVTCIQ
jgi:hypothetical protein